jgi:hypothetical protein
MGTQGIDIILAMNWLHRNQAIVSYDKMIVRLVTELIMPDYLEEGAYHHMSVDGKDANLLEALKVVSEFPPMFLEELPGMSPERKVEFAIELEPCTTPISKRAYRVFELELVELRSRSTSC